MDKLITHTLGERIMTLYMICGLGKLLILDSDWSEEDSNLGEGTTTYEMESEILGYHVYFKSWKPKVIDVFSTDHARTNANRIKF